MPLDSGVACALTHFSNANSHAAPGTSIPQKSHIKIAARSDQSQNMRIFPEPISPAGAFPLHALTDNTIVLWY